MDLPNIPLNLSDPNADLPKETFIEPKLTDSVSSLQNSSELALPNFYEQHPNSQLQMNITPVQDQQHPVKFEQEENKNQESEEDSSQESGEQEIKGVVKSGREQKFKRSTNNSHKKFISVARRWLFKNHRGQLKVAFQNKFHNFRSTRTYFFIILAFIKTIMNEQKQRQFQTHFTKQVSLKILEYEKQIENTTNENLKHFRSDEVTDLKFSIKACDVYFEGDLDKSIQCVYKKDKITIVKKHHYEEALKTVRGIQNEFRDPNFLQNTINTYGGKKLKNRLMSNDDSWLRNKDGVLDKENRSRFFVAEMFGLKVGYVSETFYSSKRYRQMRMKQREGNQKNVDGRGQKKVEEQNKVDGEGQKKVDGGKDEEGQRITQQGEQKKGEVEEVKMEQQNSEKKKQALVDRNEGSEWVEGKKILKVVLIPVSKKIDQQTNVSNSNEVLVREQNEIKIEEQL